LGQPIFWVRCCWYLRWSAKAESVLFTNRLPCSSRPARLACAEGADVLCLTGTQSARVSTPLSDWQPTDIRGASGTSLKKTVNVEEIVKPCETVNDRLTVEEGIRFLGGLGGSSRRSCAELAQTGVRIGSRTVGEKCRHERVIAGSLPAVRVPSIAEEFSRISNPG